MPPVEPLPETVQVKAAVPFAPVESVAVTVNVWLPGATVVL